MNKYLMYCILFVSCSQNEKIISKSYPRAIGDIKYNSSIDGGFKRCGTYPKDTVTSFSNSYYGTIGFKYQGELYAIKNHFKDNYKMPLLEKESGIITIRFLINCEGQSGMFRILQVDNNLNQKKLNKKISNEILKYTKQLDGWQTFQVKDKSYDYYQYLSFVIDKGQIIEITP